MSDALDITPRTWSVGEIVTAAELNTELRDKILAVANRMSDTGWISDPTQVTCVAGWSCGQFQVRKVGHLVCINFVFTRTGAAISGSATGNITNLGIANINNSAYIPGVYVGISPAWGGVLWGGWVQAGDGLIGLNALPPNTGIATNDTLYGSATYLDA